MAEKDVAGVLGLAQKAGKLSSGDLGVKLLLIASDSSPNTEKELRFLAGKADVTVIQCMKRSELGLCIGKAPRAAVAVLDTVFAGLIIKKMNV